MDPAPELKRLKSFGLPVVDFKLDVSYEKSNITPKDVEAIFVYGIQTAQKLEIEVIDGYLNTGTNQLTLKLQTKPVEIEEGSDKILC